MTKIKSKTTIIFSIANIQHTKEFDDINIAASYYETAVFLANQAKNLDEFDSVFNLLYESIFSDEEIYDYNNAVYTITFIFEYDTLVKLANNFENSFIFSDGESVKDKLYQSYIDEQSIEDEFIKELKEIKEAL